MKCFSDMQGAKPDLAPNSAFALRISPLEPAGEQAWDDFVRGHENGTFFHLSPWRRVIEKTFGHQTHYLLARRGSAVAGVLPLTHVKSMLFGSSLISNGFCVHGGILPHDEQAKAALAAEAVKIGERENVDCVEFRSTTPQHPDWVQKSGLYVTFRRPIHGDVEANLKAIPRKQRAMVRKGISNGLTSVCDGDVGRMHDVYAESVRNLGTPVFARGYFQLLKDEFGAACDVVTVLHAGTPVAAVLNFYFRDEVLPYYGGGRSQARDLAANDFMYWEVMRRACERGYKVFDFGRSKVGTGAFSFKKNWGFEPTPLTYEFRLIKATAIPEVNPLNPKFRAFIALWKRMPLPLTKLLGPSIVRGLG
jgi:FemAB-related protein (PEP-CTERM system-associated)